MMYDGFYESNIDYAVIGRNIYQHTIHAAIDIVVKDKYPLKIYFTTRFSNSSLLKNITDLNFQFNNNDFKNRIKESLLRWSDSQFAKTAELSKLGAMIAAREGN